MAVRLAPLRRTTEMDAFLEEVKSKHDKKMPSKLLKEGNHPVLQVKIPAGRQQKRFIDLLARYVARHGIIFEDAIKRDCELRGGPIREYLTKDLEAGKVGFRFLHEVNSEEGIYYRWRMFAFTQGDGLQKWRTEPFQIARNGAVWMPPPLDRDGRSKSRSPTGNFAKPKTSATFAKVKDKDKAAIGLARLTQDDKDEFLTRIRELEGTRYFIFDLMIWCMEHSEAAQHIVEVLSDAILEAGPADQYTTRLFLISDLLHNSGSAKAIAAAAFRREFEENLPEVFERLHSVFRSLLTEEGDLEAMGKMREEVTGVLRSWIQRAVFTKEYILGLEASFFRQVVPADDLLAPQGFQHELEIKVHEWRAQHFSQLEKICKKRGLRYATMGLFPDSKNLVQEATRKREWLLDRLVMYEIHVFERAPDPVPEPDPETQAPAQPEIVLPPPNPELDGESCVGSDLEDIDGEAVEPRSQKRKKREKSKQQRETSTTSLGRGGIAPRLKKYWECTNVHSSFATEAIDMTELLKRKKAEERRKKERKKAKEEARKKKEQEALLAAQKKAESVKKDQKKEPEKQKEVPSKKKAKTKHEQAQDHEFAMSIPQGEAAARAKDDIDGQELSIKQAAAAMKKGKYAVDIANSDMFRDD
eukprot:gnl/MRDRNA2_/MRDRNA2_96933_c0_seq1.p1 gnl/MRDRNA2_/MRDRNA2_96933_c0~~gnl/MRDRNA2_/MRDRNA2_96933_c0_seq1.p1  ORF type:complete len:682 (+),score=175.10 gnl/MRDRNA2_/MRDRNA2_96933_c0_seq1:123-2048(+)